MTAVRAVVAGGRWIWPRRSASGRPTRRGSAVAGTVSWLRRSGWPDTAAGSPDRLRTRSRGWRSTRQKSIRDRGTGDDAVAAGRHLGWRRRGRVPAAAPEGAAARAAPPVGDDRRSQGRSAGIDEARSEEPEAAAHSRRAPDASPFHAPAALSTTRHARGRCRWPRDAAPARISLNGGASACQANMRSPATLSGSTARTRARPPGSAPLPDSGYRGQRYRDERAAPATVGGSPVAGSVRYPNLVPDDAPDGTCSQSVSSTPNGIRTRDFLRERQAS